MEPAPAPTSVEGASSPLAEHSRAIDCPVSVLQNLRSSVLERFNATPHGGGEVSGVLFGSRNGDEVRITAFCACAEDSGLQQSAALTETQRAITSVIAASRDQPELAGLEPVGWFRAHPRCQLPLDTRDLEIANTLFPQMWQVVLVMRPGNSAATRVCFYFRETEGPWTTDCTVREFTMPAGELSPSRDLPAVIPEPFDENGQPGELAPGLDTLLGPPETREPRRFPVFAVTVCTLLAMAGGIYYWYMRPQPLGLRLQMTDSAGQVRIAWDRMAVRNARVGYVEIVDGGQTERVDLDAGQLQIGYVNHPLRPNQMSARLVVVGESNTPAEEVTQFTAPAGTVPAAGTETADANANSETATERTPEMDVPVPVDTADTPEDVSAPVPRGKFQPPVPDRPKPAAIDQAPPPEVSGPAQVAHNAPVPVVPQTVIHTEPPPEKPAPERTDSGLKLRPAPANPAATAATAPAQNAARPAAPRAQAQPTSGRVIWIGRLQKNQPVVIAKNSLTGTLIGDFPGRPFKFSLSPGDLSSDGIVLYSSNMQYANTVVEPPSSQNGWNRTSYTWNPKLANDVTIEEVPGPQNGWNRLALRSKNPKISVIVIDWTVVNGAPGF